MNCPYCHQETGDTVVFCTKCGKRIPRCPTCGAVVTHRIRFCTRDGAPIPEELTRELPELESASAAAPAEHWRDEEGPIQTSAPKAPKKSAGTGVVLIVAILAAAAIMALAFLWTKGMLDQSGDETTEENQTSVVDEAAEPDAAVDDSLTEGTEEETEQAEETEQTEETNQADQIEVSLTAHTLELYVGESCQIIGANADQVSWTYSDPGIVEVNGSGQLTARAEGSVVATATGPNGETDSVEVTVLAVETEEQQEPEKAEETENAGDEETADTSGDYVLPNSSSEYISESDLYGLTEWECRVARNEIYARHGRLFDDDTLQEYFNSKSWYYGYIAPGDFTMDVLNDYEVKNLKVIVDYEKEMNYNQTK